MGNHKYCKNCEHFQQLSDISGIFFEYVCSISTKTNLITGIKTKNNCVIERFIGSCGKEGKNFKLNPSLISSLPKDTKDDKNSDVKKPINFGYANGWGNHIPEVVKNCTHDRYHKQIDKCLTKIGCNICNYYYLVDSSD